MKIGPYTIMRASEAAALEKVRPTTKSLADKGYTAEDITSCRVHFRRNPRRKIVNGPVRNIGIDVRV